MTQCVPFFSSGFTWSLCFLDMQPKKPKTLSFDSALFSFSQNKLFTCQFSISWMSRSGLKFRWLVSFTLWRWRFKTVKTITVHLDWLPMHKCHITFWNPNYSRCETSTKCLFQLFDRLVKRYPSIVCRQFYNIVYTQNMLSFVLEVIQ